MGGLLLRPFNFLSNFNCWVPSHRTHPHTHQRKRYNSQPFSKYMGGLLTLFFVWIMRERESQRDLILLSNVEGFKYI